MYVWTLGWAHCYHHFQWNKLLSYPSFTHLELFRKLCGSWTSQLQKNSYPHNLWTLQLNHGGECVLSILPWKNLRWDPSKSEKCLHKITPSLFCFVYDFSTICFCFWNCIRARFKSAIGLKKHQIDVFLVFSDSFDVLISKMKKNLKQISF